MKLLLDTVEYKSKPLNAGKVTNSIIKYPVDITIEKLASEIVKGKSFTLSSFHDIDGKINRSKEQWKSQQLICLDFDNEHVVVGNGKSRKIRSITKTWEQAKEEFKDIAVFMYKTFNYTDDHPKFRVVFITSEEITDSKLMDYILDDFKNKYIDADSKCFERARMLYGGTEVFIFDYNNKVDVDNYKYNYNIGVKDDSSVISSEGVWGLQYSLDNNISAIDMPKPPLVTSRVDNITLIKSRYIDKLQDILNPVSIKFYTYSETIEYIKKQDLSILLGIYNPNKFNCIFHDDHNPSASIIRNNESGDYIYCCQSNNCTFGTGMVVKCIERLVKCNRVKALKFLREIYKVDFYQTEWQREQIEYLDENIRYLQSPDFQTEYPIQYGLIKNYINDLVMFIHISKDYIPAEHYSDEHANVLFYMSLRHFAKVCGKSDIKRIGDRLALFTFLKYIYKLNEEEIPTKLLENAKKELVQNKRDKNLKSMNLISFYSIPSYSESTLGETEDKAKEFKNNHFTMKGISREMFVRALGKEEANRIYPQTKSKKISEKSHAITSEIESAAMEVIKLKGWVTEGEIIKIIDEKVTGSKDSKKRQMKKMIGELLLKYGLDRKRANKVLLKRLGIDMIINDDGVECYPFIIFKK